MLKGDVASMAVVVVFFENENDQELLKAETGEGEQLLSTEDVNSTGRQLKTMLADILGSLNFSLKTRSGAKLTIGSRTLRSQIDASAAALARYENRKHSTVYRRHVDERIRSRYARSAILFDDPSFGVLGHGCPIVKMSARSTCDILYDGQVAQSPNLGSKVEKIPFALGEEVMEAFHSWRTRSRSRSRTRKALAAVARKVSAWKP